MKGWSADDITRLQNKGLVVEDRPKPPNISNLSKLSEDDLQRQCFSWFTFQYAEYCKRFFHIPNGGQRNIIVAKKLKDQGTISGVWDLFLSVPKHGYSGLFIEMKVGKNGLTDNQIAFRKANEKDYLFKVCYSIEEFQKVIKEYL